MKGNGPSYSLVSYMSKSLAVSVAQFTHKGCKPINQDCHGVRVPHDELLTMKGVTCVLADGISSSSVSQDASQTCVNSLLDDYYCTSQAWTVKTSVNNVLNAINSWLYSQTRRSKFRDDFNKGYVCTLSALILKSTTAHIFHVGDCRVYRVRHNTLTQLTQDHRVIISEHENYLAKAMGMKNHLDVDYQSLALQEGDVFLLMTDGVYEHISDDFILATLADTEQNLDLAVDTLVHQALNHGSDDNLTAQIVRIDQLPIQTEEELYNQLTQLPFCSALNNNQELDGLRILQSLYASSRSHVYLAQVIATQEKVVIKIPSVEQHHDTAYLERFLLEDWIAQRVDNPYVVKSPVISQKSCLYSVMEYVDGKTLTQWMRDHPNPSVESVRVIVEQIAKGLQSFHRLEMLHQDLRPENILISHDGQVKIIDFGSAKVAGILEIDSPLLRLESLGTVQYMAPEYFLGESGATSADIYSLGVITYQMLSGRLPYGDKVARCTSRAAQNKLVYESVLDDHRDIPVWMDSVLKKALHIQPHMRYQELSEFVYDLRHPSTRMLNQAKGPLLERNPLLFWQSVSAILLGSVLYLSAKLYL